MTTMTGTTNPPTTLAEFARDIELARRDSATASPVERVRRLCVLTSMLRTACWRPGLREEAYALAGEARRFAEEVARAAGYLSADDAATANATRRAEVTPYKCSSDA
jgi:hypothetical protein